MATIDCDYEIGYALCRSDGETILGKTMLCRELGIGHRKAKRVLERMVEEGLAGPGGTTRRCRLTAHGAEEKAKLERLVEK